MGDADLKADLLHYLREGRADVLRGLEGLSEYDARRPMTPSGTNILGLVKHLVGVETGSLASCLGRPAPFTLPWVEDGSIWQGADMWARADESSEYLVDLYRRAARHSDANIEALPLDVPATVPWWPEERRSTTLGHLVVRVIAETAHHAGHIDVVRETIDGRGGRDKDEIATADEWTTYVARIQSEADRFRT